MFNAFFRFFESRIDAFGTSNEAPPERVFAYILHYVRQTPIVFCLALVFGGLLGLVEIMLFAYMGDVVDLMSETSPETVFATYAPTLLWMAFFVVFLRTGLLVMSTVLDEQVIVPGFFSRVRWQSHKHVMAHNLSYFEDDFAGRIATKVAASGQSLGDFLISLLQVIWLFIIYVVGSLFLFGSLNGALIAILVVWCVAYTAILVNFVPRIRRRAKTLAEGVAGVNGRLVDTYSNMRLVKLDGAHGHEDAFIKDGMDRLVRAVRLYTRNITGMRFSLHAINGIMVVAVGYTAILLWQQATITIGDIAFALGLVIRLTILATRMLGQFNTIFRTLGTIQNVMETITEPIHVTDRPDAHPIGHVRGEISFNDVRFQYGKTGPPHVLNGVSLNIASGEKIGLVGPSGAGKSTMVSLLLRLYDLESGSILVDGENIAHVQQASLRANIGVVSQETALLNRSVRDNIAYANPNASEAAVFEAAKQAEAHDFITGLQDIKGRSGYDAHVGERGVKLSGGQRQRLAIARVILKNAPILILDEATSALDSESEAAIRDSLDFIMRDKTVIAIAHRLSTIAAMDRLIVLNEGQIVEMGTHDSLVLKGGLYASLWARQSGGFIAAAE